MEDEDMRSNRTLWIIQGLLAVVFLFAGGSKFVMSVEQMNAGGSVQLPGWFLHFIGVCEILGAIGLIVPGLTGIQPRLTPIGATGLVIIMIGAVTVTLMGGMGVAAAIVPAVVGVLAAWVAYNRWPRATARAATSRA